MILLFTDFGPGGPYTGQVEAVLAREAPGVAAVRIMEDAPAMRAGAAAVLLAALVETVPPPAVWLCVVDPGVGTARRALAVRTAGRWLVGPDNGLMEPAVRRLGGGRWHEIRWRPSRLSDTFHGRDLFAPAAARLARGAPLDMAPVPAPDHGVADEPAEVIYVDPYGNCVTGLRAGAVAGGAVLVAAGRRLRRARTFGEVPPGAAFWYVDSMGLVEIAVHGGSAAARLGLRVGDPVAVERA
ncbi:hypothetical protein EDC57_0760 [Inmirania thermothiophila]|uniref:SAM-dependent chlorinase/fluorinase n=2 Tax=Inmirania thermothiophila TaxID=1750597 RepID=A0A3N1Y8I8_9GAMM|nr:hypothetical protein EDC57_0760 [Inmirania thermothiophila]